MIENAIRSEWTVGLVQRAIACRYTGDILDARTCAVLLDREGDPVEVMSPRALDALTPADHDALAKQGYRLVPNPF
jgi:hypothetical protein